MGYFISIYGARLESWSFCVPADSMKLSAYAPGNERLADVPATRFSVKLYVVLRELGRAGLWQVVVFLGILGGAFVHGIGRGGLEWDEKTSSPTASFHEPRTVRELPALHVAVGGWMLLR